ncbi:GNAT family N-acetyltransferase [Puia dinghuensis]|uniref:BioF2-like acetyltransferase domain-containing protein n=1 Tax=Puia dinghuensis TaxID=1792502 RepID=A0A8J2XVW4_9BACT|nr:GNAT family N-acetyltransferase [Puia dinghuensis]GGB14991.1 hypothetical protein GCM10011511_43420 [Puia dinghuensis]
MTTTAHIRYLQRQAIDVARWDACIERSANRLIYGFHFYLDHLTSGQWAALVLEDYKAVMPLTWRRKWGVTYLCQPAFTQQTGIFFTEPISHDSINSFLGILTRHYRFAEIYLNYASGLPTLRIHDNLILPLERPYPQLEARYKKDLVRNLRLAARSGLTYTPDIDLDTAIEAYRSQYAARHPAIRPEDYSRFRKLCLHLQPKGQLILRAAFAGDQLQATALLVRDASRLYLLQSTTLPAGRMTGANHFLIDQLIREWAGSGLTLDFEGSDIRGIAYFYANFGALREPYFFYRHNHLPWPWRLLKS